MIQKNPHFEVRLTHGERWFLGVAWVAIVVKCLLVPWAVAHWSIPVNPMWIVGPTLVFAVVATWLWLAHRE